MLVPAERDLKRKVSHLKTSGVSLKSYAENAKVDLFLKH